MQVNPGGNRRLNWALHIVAVVRLRFGRWSLEAVHREANRPGENKTRGLALVEDLHRTRNLQNDPPIFF